MPVEHLNLEFSKTLSVRIDALDWVRSPSGQVERRMLERENAESGHATSVVRYGVGAAFAPHTHSGGEEFLVLEGTFQDEHGDYPAGSYVRNPVGSSHRPFSSDGCQIFVKLCQMRAEQSERVVVTPDLTLRGSWLRTLYRDAYETVELRHMEPGETVALGGCEIFVLFGTVTVADDVFAGRSWMRSPRDDKRQLVAQSTARLWLKRGHLP